MKELLPQIDKWVLEKKPFAIGRVIQTWGSSPRPTGSALIVSRELEMAGSVSGGCVEGAVIKESRAVIESGAGKRLDYGVSDDEAWSVGLTCGGKLQVYLQAYPMERSQAEVWNRLRELLSTNQPCVLITALVDGENKNAIVTEEGKSMGVELESELRESALLALHQRRCMTLESKGTSYFVHVFPRRNLLLIVGAAHVTADLVQLAKLVDFETVVVDPRGVFAKNLQFGIAPDRIITKYPSEVFKEMKLDSNTYAVILSHDPKIDDNALQILLRSKVAYIGALGSRKTHEKRVGRLKQAGFSDREIGRIEAPIGTDINAQGAMEIALSILGSVIKTKNQD